MHMWIHRSRRAVQGGSSQPARWVGVRVRVRCRRGRDEALEAGRATAATAAASTNGQLDRAASPVRLLPGLVVSTSALPAARDWFGLGVGQWARLSFTRSDCAAAQRG